MHDVGFVWQCVSVCVDGPPLLFRRKPLLCCVCMLPCPDLGPALHVCAYTHNKQPTGPSYNVAFFPRIYAAAGYPDILHHLGSKGPEYTDPINWLLYQVLR